MALANIMFSYFRRERQKAANKEYEMSLSPLGTVRNGWFGGNSELCCSLFDHFAGEARK